MWRIHTYHHKERFTGISYITHILHILNRFLGFIYRGIFMRLVFSPFIVPIMRVLMFVKCTIREPIIKTVTKFFGSIGIPHNFSILYIFTGTLRIIRSRCVQMIFTDISTIITVLTEHIPYGSGIGIQTTFRRARIAIHRHTIFLGRVHSGHQHGTMRATYRTITLS